MSRINNVPDNYHAVLDLLDMQKAIKLAKDTFEVELARALNLTRVSAPLIVRPETGLNDNLSGVERPVEFNVKDLDANVQIVQSLAKWKRMALYKYKFEPDHGLYTDMNAIRRDEVLDNIHSMYVDQWDWEKVITREERNMETLKSTVRGILYALRHTEYVVCHKFTQIKPFIPDDIYFITSQELEDMYPQSSPKEREDNITKKYGAVFISQIGGKLNSGSPHDSRSPDYDDWSLNGDILIWNPIIKQAFEISSMGIRVDSDTLASQLAEAGCENRKEMLYHKMLLNGQLPLTIGGGIGQSRLCMLILQCAHIGEVQASIWPDQMIRDLSEKGVMLL